MHQTLGDMVAAAEQRFGDKPLIVAPDRILSFSELRDLSSRMACVLQDMGIKQGDRVTLWLENGWRWPVAYYAILRIGAVVNPCNILLTAEEVRYIAENCGARAMIASEATGLPLAGERISILVGAFEPTSDIHNFDELLASTSRTDYAQPRDMTPDSLATIGYTSGTTGFPKGATLTHRNIVANTAMTSLMHRRNSQDIVVSALPCAHVYGNIILNAAVDCGMTVVLLPRFDEEMVLKAIDEHRATMFEGTPAMYMKILTSPDITRGDFSTLRICTVGGQTMPPSKMEEVERLLKCPLVELWGMTELGGLGTTHPVGGPRVLGSIGLPLPMCEAKIVDVKDSLHEMPTDGVGELMIRGPLVMKGYYNDPAATAAAIEPNGWLHTGDLARRNGDGYIFCVDRTKEVIISGGYNIYPAEVERIIAQHASVAMVAVAALKDDILGQVAGAFVVLKPGAAEDAEGIVRHCKKHLASYKVPRAVKFLPDLPKNSTGKILRRALADG